MKDIDTLDDYMAEEAYKHCHCLLTGTIWHN
jgi:hypothetical protein